MVLDYFKKGILNFIVEAAAPLPSHQRTGGYTEVLRYVRV